MNRLLFALVDAWLWVNHAFYRSMRSDALSTEQGDVMQYGTSQIRRWRDTAGWWRSLCGVL